MTKLCNEAVLCRRFTLCAHCRRRVARDRARSPGVLGGGHIAQSEFGAAAVQPRRQVPTLQLDDGTILNETPLVLCYLDTDAAQIVLGAGNTAAATRYGHDVPAGRFCRRFSTKSHGPLFHRDCTAGIELQESCDSLVTISI